MRELALVVPYLTLNGSSGSVDNPVSTGDVLVERRFSVELAVSVLAAADGVGLPPKSHTTDGGDISGVSSH